MKKKYLYLILFLASLCYPYTIFAVCPCYIDDPELELSVNDKVILGELTLINGEKINLEKVNGDLIGILFWASWCTTCQKELRASQNLVELFEKYETYLVGVSLDYEPAMAVEFIEKEKIEFPNAFVSFEIIEKYKKIKILPMLVILSKEGVVLSVTNPPKYQDIKETLKKVVEYKSDIIVFR